MEFVNDKTTFRGFVQEQCVQVPDAACEQLVFSYDANDCLKLCHGECAGLSSDFASDALRSESMDSNRRAMFASPAIAVRARSRWVKYTAYCVAYTMVFVAYCKQTKNFCPSISDRK